MNPGDRIIERGSERRGVLVGTWPREVWNRGIPTKETWAVVLWDDSDRRQVYPFAKIAELQEVEK